MECVIYIKYFTDIFNSIL